MRRWAAAFAVVLLPPIAAVAQTTGTIDPLPIIQQFEDASGDPTALNYQYDATHTAAGLYQITITTWNSIARQADLPQVGPGTPYANVAALSADVQQQGAAYLFDTQGFNPWTCPGCDPALAAYVQQQGGPSAFALTSSEQALLSGAAAATGGTIASAASGANVSANTGSVFNPFSWLYTQYLSAVSQPLSNELAIIQGVISPGLLGLVTISLAVGFYAFAAQLKDAPALLVRIIKAGAVVLLVGVGSVLYEQYIAGLVNAIPMWFSQNILGSTSSNPASGFDVVMHDFNANAANAHWASIWNTAEAFADLGLFIASVFVFYGGLIIIIGAWFINQILLQLFLVLGPIFVLCLLFDFSYGWFHRWVGELAHQVAVTLGLDMLASLLLKVIQNAFAALPDAPNAIQAFENLFGVGLIAALLAFTVPVFWWMLASIFSAAGAPAMTAPARFLAAAGAAALGGSGGAVGKTASAVWRGTEAAGEMAIGAATSPFRRSAPPGPSLSTSSP